MTANVRTWAVARVTVLVAACAFITESCVASVTREPSSSFSLESWMSSAMPFIGDRPLLDWTLPGTHDSMTYDLSTTISDNANDLQPTLAGLLHDLHDFADVGDNVRKQAVTQPLNLTAQLNAGIRFVDFRIVYTSAPNASNTGPHSWYNLHLFESENPALDHLRAMRTWMDDHPEEVVVLWLSRHGSPCHNHYPNTSEAVMQQFWSETTSIFDGMVFEGALNETAVATMVAANTRLVVYVSSYESMTRGTSVKGFDACLLDNWLGDGVSHELSTRPYLQSHILEGSKARKAADRKEGKLFLQSMAGSAPEKQMVNAVLLNYFPGVAEFAEVCAGAFNIPNMSQWCPPSLMEVGQLTNYYSQFVLEQALLNPSYDLPNAFYLDAVGTNGVMVTSPGAVGSASPVTGYAYVATLVAFNLVRLGSTNNCSLPPAMELQSLHRVAEAVSPCSGVMSELAALRAAHPEQYWHDPTHGRLINWPPAN